MPHQVYQIFYVSQSAFQFTPKELEELVEHSASNNAKADIHGALLYKRGSFLQVLEGEEEKVKTLLEKIKQDRRHFSIVVLKEQHTAKHEFQNWSMKLFDLEELNHSEQVNHFQIEQYNPASSSGTTQKLIDYFIANF